MSSKNLSFHVIKIPISHRNKLADDPKFILLIQLCRFLNQLSFCVRGYTDYRTDKTPIGNTQRQNAMFFASSVLWEAMLIVKKLGKEFKSYKSYKAGFETFFKLEPVKKIYPEPLKKIRNGVGFHNGDLPIQETLQTLNIRTLYLTATTSDKFGDMHYMLADDIALNYVLGDLGSAEAEVDYFIDLYQTILQVIQIFIDFSNKLILEHKERKRWLIEKRDSF